MQYRKTDIIKRFSTSKCIMFRSTLLIFMTGFNFSIFQRVPPLVFGLEIFENSIFRYVIPGMPYDMKSMFTIVKSWNLIVNLLNQCFQISPQKLSSFISWEVIALYKNRHHKTIKLLKMHHASFNFVDFYEGFSFFKFSKGPPYGIWFGNFRKFDFQICHSRHALRYENHVYDSKILKS